MTIPNILTILRLILVPVFIVVSFRGAFLAAFVIFLAAAFTDVFDGMIARRFNQRSRLGAILDPAADKTMMVGAYLFYTLHPRVGIPVPGWLTFAIFVRDLLIAGFAYLLFSRVHVKRFPPSVAGKISTLLQATAVATTIAVNSFLPSFAGILQALFRVTLVATLFSAWIYLRQGERLLNEA